MSYGPQPIEARAQHYGALLFNNLHTLDGWRSDARVTIDEELLDFEVRGRYDQFGVLSMWEYYRFAQVVGAYVREVPDRAYAEQMLERLAMTLHHIKHHVARCEFSYAELSHMRAALDLFYHELRSWNIHITELQLSFRKERA